MRALLPCFLTYLISFFFLSNVLELIASVLPSTGPFAAPHAVVQRDQSVAGGRVRNEDQAARTHMFDPDLARLCHQMQHGTAVRRETNRSVTSSSASAVSRSSKASTLYSAIVTQYWPPTALFSVSSKLDFRSRYHWLARTAITYDKPKLEWNLCVT